jgi:PAS domain S-box-containing protein
MKIAAPSDHLYQQAFDHSLQANIIFIVSDGRIVTANRAACKLLGYTKKELLDRNREDIFKISEAAYEKMQEDRKKSGKAKAIICIIQKNGILRPCEITSVIFKDDRGIPNSIMNIGDLRTKLLIQKKIDAENQKLVAGDIIIAQSKSDSMQADNLDWIKSITGTTYDVIWSWDMVPDLISFGTSYEKVFGYPLPKHKISFSEWIKFFQPAERNDLSRRMETVLKSEKKKWNFSFPFLCPDGASGRVTIRSNILRDQGGKAIRMIGVIHDVSNIQRLEGLQRATRTKERHAIEAIVEAKEMERSDIGKELHDNVNQLLVASILYLSMARKDLKNGDIYLRHSLEYTRTAIEEIRKLSKGLTEVGHKDFNLLEAIGRLSRDTMETTVIKINCTLDKRLEEMSVKFKLNMFRILQEQLNNIVRHARASAVQIVLASVGKRILFTISDDGVGFDSAQKSTGIGISNIISRATLYNGKAEFITEPGKGCQLALCFPKGNTAHVIPAPRSLPVKTFG